MERLSQRTRNSSATCLAASYVLVNRMKSDSSRGRSIASDSHGAGVVPGPLQHASQTPEDLTGKGGKERSGVNSFVKNGFKNPCNLIG